MHVQCVVVSVIIISIIILFWLPFTGNFKIQSPLACLQAGGKYEELTEELKNLREELKEKEKAYDLLKDQYHDVMVEMVKVEELKEKEKAYDLLKDQYHDVIIKMVKVEMKFNESEKELTVKREELKHCNQFKDKCSESERNGDKKYYQQQLSDKDLYHELQLNEQIRNNNLTVQIKVCEERLRACNDQFNVMTDVIPVKEESDQGSDQCPDNDPACYYTKKAGHILSWMLHLGGDTKNDNPSQQ